MATNLHFLYHPEPQIKFESRIQTGPFPYTTDIGDAIGIAEYLWKSSTISLTLYNPRRVSGCMTIGFLHSFNNNFCAGAELLTQWQRCSLNYRLALAARYVWHVRVCFFIVVNTQCSVNTIDWVFLYTFLFLFKAHKCVCAFSFPFLSNYPNEIFEFYDTKILVHCRYSLKKSSVAATLSKEALDISFWHQSSDFMQLGASLIWIHKISRPLVSFCYQLEMKDSIVKAMIDSDFAVGCTYSRYLLFLKSFFFTSISLIRILVKSVIFN